MKTINKYILLTITVLIFNLSYSQKCDNHNKHKQKMEAEKIAFVTTKLDLSVEEAQKFWPVYNELKENKSEFLKNKRAIMKKLRKSFDTMSEKEIEASLDKSLNIDLEIDKLRIDYNGKFKKAIGVKKTAIFYESEREFRRTLLRNIKSKHCNK